MGACGQSSEGRDGWALPGLCDHLLMPAKVESGCLPHSQTSAQPLPCSESELCLGDHGWEGSPPSGTSQPSRQCSRTSWEGLLCEEADRLLRQKSSPRPSACVLVRRLGVLARESAPLGPQHRVIQNITVRQPRT